MNEIPEMFIEGIPTDNHPTGVGQMATPSSRWRSPMRSRNSPACACATPR
jgi:hypothetical protein